MIEFAFCLPILGFLLALIFFFGWSMNNQQHVEMAARHSVWRSVYPPGETRMGLNAAFFAGKSDDVTLDSNLGWETTMPQTYMDVMQFPEQSSRQLAQAMVIDTFPKAQESTVAAHFPTSVGLWKQFQGNLTGSIAREGVEWRRNQVDWTNPVRTQFLTDLDNTLNSIPSPGNGLGVMVQQLYMAHW